MAAVPTLPDTERRTTYAGLTANVGPFNVGFAVYGNGTDYANWVEVWLGTTQLVSGTDYTLTVPTGSLSTRERPITDAQITPAGSYVGGFTGNLNIVGAERPRRTSQLVENKGVSARDFNQIITQIVARQRENWDKFKRAVVVPFGETMAVLATAATRADHYAKFDASGNLVPGGTVTSIEAGAAAASASASAAAGSASAASGFAGAASTSAGAAAASAVLAASLAANLTGTSTTSNAIGTGSKSWTTQAGKDFGIGRELAITSDANPTVDRMFGTVTAWNALTGAVTINVVLAEGSGTHTDWTIKVGGARGGTGAAGGVGPAGPVVDRAVRVATTANGTLATAFANGQTVDGVVLATGDLILIKNQSAPAENGVYVVAASGAPARDDDYDTYNEIAGALVSVQEGTVNADTIWLCTSNRGGTLNTTAIVWAQYNADASNTVKGIVKVSTSASAATGSATDEALRVVDAAANYVAQGYHVIGAWPARALIRPTTSAADALAQAESTTNKVNYEHINFPNASTKYVEFSFPAPKSMNVSSTFDVEVEWTEEASATAHVCRWQGEMQAQSDADTIDSAWGTAVAVDDTGSSGTRRKIKISAITPAGSWAAEDTIHVRVARLGAHANDTLDVGARLIRATVFGVINVKNDA